MDSIDIAVAVIVAGFALFLLYRSFWKKGGACSGCEVSDCDLKTYERCDSPDKQVEWSRQ